MPAEVNRRKEIIRGIFIAGTRSSLSNDSAETSTHLIPPQARWKVRGSVVEWPSGGKQWRASSRGAILGGRSSRSRGPSDQGVQPPGSTFLGESPAMIRRKPIVAWGLLLAHAILSLPARGQEPTARDEAATRGAASAPPYKDWYGSGDGGAVAAGGRDAVRAGIEILNRGGNAADAAAATILALSVTDSRSFCFGGEVPIMVYDARTKGVTVIAGQGAAPRLATREEFAKRGGIPRTGITAAAVPAALDACLTLLDRFGTMSFAQVVGPTRLILARPPRREAWHADFARTLETLVAAEGLANPGGPGEPAGNRSRGLRLVADAFYRGPIARRIDAWSRANGGLIRYTDLAAHMTRIEEPVSATYRGHTVYKCGVWTQGPCLLQALQILEGYDLKTMGRDKPETIHTIVEALKLAMADRDTYYADPLFADVPLAELLMPEYASQTAGPDRPQARLARAAARRSPRGQAAARPRVRPGRAPPGAAGGRRPRHDHLPGRRQGRQRRRGHAQRLVGRRGRRHRRLAGQPAPELQHLGGTSRRHRARQAPADHPVADDRARRQRPARAGGQRRRGRQPGPDDLAGPGRSHRLRPRSA